MFGEDFATSVSELPTRCWSGPIRSPYGLHLVWLAEKRASGVPSIDEVRTQVLQAYRAERQREYSRRMMQEIRAAYEVRVESGVRTDG